MPEVNVFDKIADSEARQGGVYPIPGVYPVLWVDAIKMIKNRKGADIFIAELCILDSEVEGRPRGTKMSWVVNLAYDASPGNIKSFLVAALGVTPDQLGSEEIKMCCSDANPCQGRLVRLEAVNAPTRAGNDFTKCQWRVIPKDKQDQAKELREAAGFSY